jgi:calcium-translocating P-type ATPase
VALDVDAATADAAQAPPAAFTRAGLSQQEAEQRLAHDGPNVLPAMRRRSPLARLVDQLTHFFALMLWAAAALAVVAGMPQLAIAIAAVVIVNGVFSFVQEHRADRAADRLRDLLPVRTTVRRDGRRRIIDPAGIVRDDVVLLRLGDRISADMTVGLAHEVAVDTSMLTGESVPVVVGVGDQLFAGTFVVQGEAEAVVTATGGDTRLAAIARLAREAQRPLSPLAVEIGRVVRLVAALALGVGACFFVLAVALGMSAGKGFLFAIGVTVALVPEGLLPTVTLSLAIGAQRMAERRALVRRLESVETLGSTTFICTDKTGTLTRNEMTVVAAWTPAGSASSDDAGYDPAGSVRAETGAREAVVALARAGARASDGRVTSDGAGWHAHGDPMEAALDVFARRLGVDVVAEDSRLGTDGRYPFDPQRRRASLVCEGWLLVKGAPDSVLARCAGEPTQARAVVDEYAARGLRVLALARRPADEIPAGATSAEAEDGLELLGVVGLEDPPRSDVAEAIDACRQAGIRVAMVTGDHPATAAAIARKVGLATDDSLVVEGAELPADDQVLGALLDRDGVVAARVTPEDKLRIARALQARGHVVAMTGDGVNDGPALQEASIGIAMGASGTDVAREAADLVLLDDHFATIVAAIEQGRATYANVRRFLTYHLTDNVAELTPFVVWALSAGHVPLAIGVLQVLMLDIGTDLLPALALGTEPASPRVLTRPPERRHLIDRTLLVRVFGILGPVESLVSMAAFLTALLLAGWSIGDPEPTGQVALAASGAAFTAIVLGQCGNVFALRSATRRPGQLGWFSNRFVVVAVVVELVTLLGLLYVGRVAHVLGQAPPPWRAVLVAALAPVAVLGADAVHKAVRGRRRAG